jgi:hypothetical protein
MILAGLAGSSANAGPAKQARIIIAKNETDLMKNDGDFWTQSACIALYLKKVTILPQLHNRYYFIIYLKLEKA